MLSPPLPSPHVPPQALLKTGEHSWSLAELVQALVLLTHYHSLASFVFGCGINPEAGQDGGHGCRPPSPHSDGSPTAEDGMGCSGVRSGGWESPPCGAVPSCWALPHKPQRMGCGVGPLCGGLGGWHRARSPPSGTETPHPPFPRAGMPCVRWRH